MQSQAYSEEFKIRSYEMDAEGRVSIQSICNYLQEIAGLHAAILGFSVTELLKRNLTWVLSRLHVQMDKYPHWGDAVTVETWPSVMTGLFALREFIIRDRTGGTIGRATTSWMILDLRTKKAIEMPEFITSVRLQNSARALDDPFHKLPLPEDPSYQQHFNVRRSDLDINQHVNNVNYIEWAIEAIPVAHLQGHHIASFEISYRAESHYGDRIASKCAVDEANRTFFHILAREGKKDQVALARTRIKPNR